MTNPLASPSIGLAVLTLRVLPGSPRIRVIPAGRFDAPRGSMGGSGPWTLSAAAAARIVALNAARQADILVDYEHQWLSSKDNGKEVPAAGWINPRSLVWVESGLEPGLYGEVKWTAKAAEMIAADQYRYLSPVFTYDKTTGEPSDLLNVALTNFPAIDGATAAAALAAQVPGTSGPLMGSGLHSVEVFNRSFAALGVLHPDTERAIAACGVSRAEYMERLDIKTP